MLYELIVSEGILSVMKTVKNKQASQPAMATLTTMGFADKEIESITEYPEYLFFQRSMLIVSILFIIVFIAGIVAYSFVLIEIRRWLMESRTGGLDYLSYETVDIFHVTPLCFAIILGTVALFYVLRDLAYHILLKVRLNPQRAQSRAGRRLRLLGGRFVYFQLLARGQSGAARPGQTIIKTFIYTLAALLVTALVAVLDFSNYALITEEKITKRGYGSATMKTFEFADVVQVETLCEEYYDRGVNGMRKTAVKYALHFRNGYEINLFNYVDKEKLGKLLRIDQRVFAANPDAGLTIRQQDQHCIEYLKDTYDEKFAAVARLLRIKDAL